MKKVSITIQLDNETIELLDAMSASMSLSRSSCIRMIILNAIKEKDLCMDTFTKGKTN